MAAERILLREIVTAKDIAMPIEMDERIRNLLDGCDKPTAEEVLIDESDLLRKLGKAIAARYLYEGHPICPLACSAMDDEPHATDCLIGEILRRTCWCGEWMLGWHFSHNPTSITAPNDEFICTDHKWTGHKNNDTPDGPGEYFEYCEHCGKRHE